MYTCNLTYITQNTLILVTIYKSVIIHISHYILKCESLVYTTSHMLGSLTNSYSYIYNLIAM